MAFLEQNGLKYFQFDIFKDQPVFHAILTRHGGFSLPPYDRLNTGGTVGDDPQTVLRNHMKIYHTFGLEFASKLDVWQVHGTNIVCGDRPRMSSQAHEKADGILTDKQDITLFMRFADCVPIMLMDPVNKVVGLIHAGWKGTYLKIAHKAVEKMGTCYGSNPRDILAGIGPSICQRCYEVGSEVFEAFSDNLGSQSEGLFLREEDHYFLDLWKANQIILEESGVRQIEVAGICTACHLEDWYSHRAEEGKTGRFGALIKLAQD